MEIQVSSLTDEGRADLDWSNFDIAGTVVASAQSDIPSVQTKKRFALGVPESLCRIRYGYRADSRVVLNVIPPGIHERAFLGAEVSWFKATLTVLTVLTPIPSKRGSASDGGGELCRGALAGYDHSTAIDPLATMVKRYGCAADFDAARAAFEAAWRAS
jgi:hypothetical protein